MGFIRMLTFLYKKILEDICNLLLYKILILDPLALIAYDHMSSVFPLVLDCLDVIVNGVPISVLHPFIVDL